LYPEKRYTFAWPSSADGTIRADVAAEEVAVAVLGQLRGIGLQRLVDSPAIDTERLRRSVTDHWRRTLASPEPAQGSAA